MLHAIQFQLGRPVQDIPYLLPVNQVPAVKYGKSREIGKAGCDQVIVLPHPAYGWIGIKTRQYGIFKDPALLLQHRITSIR